MIYKKVADGIRIVTTSEIAPCPEGYEVVGKNIFKIIVPECSHRLIDKVRKKGCKCFITRTTCKVINKKVTKEQCHTCNGRIEEAKKLGAQEMDSKKLDSGS